MVKDRASGSCSFDIGALVVEKGTLRKSKLDSRVGEIGSWHTHPDDDGRPSPQDLAAWLNARDFLDCSRYIGLILTAHASDERWSRPIVHAWVVRRDELFGTALCEPARFEAL